VLYPPAWLPGEDSIEEALDGLVRRLEDAGVRVDRTAPEGLGDWHEYYALYHAFMGALEGTGLSEERRERRARTGRAAGSEFMAAYARGLEGSAGDLLSWHLQRQRYREAFRSFFRTYDVLLSPVNIVNAFPHTDEPVRERRFEIGGTSVPYWQQSFYAGIANLSGHPATAFPAGRTGDGLPVGLQVVGPYLEDRTPIRFTALVAEEYGGFSPPPGFSDTE
jgi:amidase